jgi:uncharacterized membrane protein YuzA (DUF378 family)
MRTTIDFWVTALLVIVGLNCGLIALFNYDLLAVSFHAVMGGVLNRLFLGLVGLAALYQLIIVLQRKPLTAH